jgi:hypothetical protein
MDGYGETACTGMSCLLSYLSSLGYNVISRPDGLACRWASVWGMSSRGMCFILNWRVRRVGWKPQGCNESYGVVNRKAVAWLLGAATVPISSYGRGAVLPPYAAAVAKQWLM